MRRTLSALAAGVLVVALASPAMGADKNQSDNPPKAGPAKSMPRPAAGHNDAGRSDMDRGHDRG